MLPGARRPKLGLGVFCSFGALRVVGMQETKNETPSRLPIEAGFFTIPDDPAALPRLLGSACRICGEVFFPRRVICAKCLEAGLDDLELGPRGTLYTYTWVHVPLFGALRSDAAGYGVGQVDLEEGPRVQAVLSCPRETLAIGMSLRLELETLSRTEAGDELVIFRFGPGEASP